MLDETIWIDLDELRTDIPCFDDSCYPLCHKLAIITRFYCCGIILFLGVPAVKINDRITASNVDKLPYPF